MKILFVCSEEKWLGVSCLSGYLKKHDHEVYLLFDPLFFNKSYFRNEKIKKLFSIEGKFINKIKEIQPDLIGFSVVTANYQWALEKARLFKKHFNIPIIFGGPHPTIVPQDVISNSQVDMVAIGEAEESLLELADSDFKRKDIRGIWFKHNGKIFKNPIMPLEQNLDKYPFPDDNLFYEQLPPSYRLTPTVMTSRGCPFSCTYCGNQTMQKLYKGAGDFHWVRQRSVANVISELLWRKGQHGSKHFIFMDDIFSSKLEWLKEFVKQYKDKIRLPFNCLSHPNIVQEETIKLLKEAGCILIDFGLQTGCPKIREEVLNRNEDNDKVVKITQFCKKYKLNFAVDCILNIPFDNEQTIKESIIFYNSIRPNIINCFKLLYFPGTKIIEIAKRAGIINEKDEEMIVKGQRNRYASMGINNDKTLDDYQKYAFLLTAMPLLPKKLVEKIINNNKLFAITGNFPSCLLVFIKVAVQLKAGFGFIFFNVIKNEIFYLKQYSKNKKVLL